MYLLRIQKIQRMRFVQKEPLLFCLVLIMSQMLLASCATHKPLLTANTAVSGSPITLTDDVLVLQPVITYEKISNEEKLSSSEFGGQAIESNLFRTAKRAVTSRKINVVEPKTLKETEESEIIGKIIPMIPKLSRGIVDYQTSKTLKSFYSISNRRVILVNFVRVKVGTRGGWNPISGEISSSNTSSLFNAALIQADTGQIIWKRQVFLRDIPSLAHEAYYESLKLLYKDFPRKENR